MTWYGWAELPLNTETDSDSFFCSRPLELLRCECLLENLENRYLGDAGAAGVDVASSFKGREGTSVDVFHFRHLQLAVEASTPALEKERPPLRHRALTPHRNRSARNRNQRPHGSGDTWR